MGRGRQKAKQTKIARKLKYLTTDTDYDELAKELSGKEPGEGPADPFTVVEAEYGHANSAEKSSDTVGALPDTADAASAPADDDLDDYARWAAEAAAKATSGEMPVTPKPRKRIPIPVPSILGHGAPKKDTKDAAAKTESQKAGAKATKTGKSAVSTKTAGSKASSAKVADKTSASKTGATKVKTKASGKTSAKSASKATVGSGSGRKSTASKSSTKAGTKASGTAKAGSKKAE
ncbi:hypothetical protein DKK72_00250 [Bifidobacterium indicum]|nr:hypothetical protein DKK72_00250 [Bifidobacterium indicum]